MCVPEIVKVNPTVLSGEKEKLADIISVWTINVQTAGGARTPFWVAQPMNCNNFDPTVNRILSSQQSGAFPPTQPYKNGGGGEGSKQYAFWQSKCKLKLKDGNEVTKRKEPKCAHTVESASWESISAHFVKATLLFVERWLSFKM